MSDSSNVSQFVSNHPKIVGVLFALLLFVSQAGTVSAGAYTVISGP